MESGGLEALEKIAKGIPEPKSLFRGMMQMPFELPNNLILFQRLNVNALGQEHYYHYRFVLIVNLRTEGTIVLDSRSFELHPGEALLVFPHQFHHYHSLKSPTLRWLFLTFELNQSESIAALRNRVFPMSSSARLYIEQLISMYLDKNGSAPEGIGRGAIAGKEASSKGASPEESSAGGEASPTSEAGTAIGMLAALTLLDLMQQEGRSSGRTTVARPSVIDQVNRYIWDNFAKDLKLADLAQVFPYSESHLRLLFRKRMGMSLGNYIQKVRMNRARSLLVSGLNVSQVAQSCGYDSLYSFSRAFKKSTTLSPLAYKKLNANKY